MWAKYNGGFIYGNALKNFDLNTCVMADIKAGGKGSLIYSPSATLVFSIASCTVGCYTGYSASTASSRIQSATNDIGGLAWIANAVSVTSNNNVF